MKRVFSLLLVCVMLLASLSVFTACEEYDEELVIYNWAEYMYEDFEEDFYEYYLRETGKKLKITYVTFDTNETMLTKVLNNDAQVDVICPSEYAIEKLVVGNYLTKFEDIEGYEMKNLGNVSGIVARVDLSFGLGTLTDYMVPYMWGTLGILYNADVIAKEKVEEAGWGLLWNTTNIDGINGKIYMKDSIRDSYAAAVLYMKENNLLPQGKGYEDMTPEQLINSVDDTMIAAAQQVLIDQKEILYGYEVDLGKDDIVKGRALLGVAWSGDAMASIETAAESGVNLDYFVPAVGSNIWFDGWVIPKTAENKVGAKIFIDFLNQPVIAMENMMEIGYTSAVNKLNMLADSEALEVYYDEYDVGHSTEEKLEANDELFNDARRYPLLIDPSLGVMHDFGDNNEKLVKMWEGVRAYGLSVWGVVLIIAGALVVIAAVIFVIYKLRNKSRRRVD